MSSSGCNAALFLQWAQLLTSTFLIRNRFNTKLQTVYTDEIHNLATIILDTIVCICIPGTRSILRFKTAVPTLTGFTAHTSCSFNFQIPRTTRYKSTSMKRTALSMHPAEFSDVTTQLNKRDHWCLEHARAFMNKSTLRQISSFHR